MGRFERKAAAEQKQIYYEGEFCEAEDMPNGFTKIRSKNLDILFKHNYYEQRLLTQNQISEKLKNFKESTTNENVSQKFVENDSTEKMYTDAAKLEEIDKEISEID